MRAPCSAAAIVISTVAAWSRTKEKTVPRGRLRLAAARRGVAERATENTRWDSCSAVRLGTVTNVAVTARSSFMLTVHRPAPAHAPPQAAKPNPGRGVAVSVTVLLDG